MMRLDLAAIPLLTGLTLLSYLHKVIFIRMSNLSLRCLRTVF
jgi:hypothetical protein